MKAIRKWIYQKMKALYFYILSSQLLFPIASKTNRFLIKILGRKYEELFFKIDRSFHKQEIRSVMAVEDNEEIPEDLNWKYDVPAPKFREPLVSIIVPNYNHALYLRERLDSIYNQTYKNYEVILLDDCSTDNSMELLCEFAQNHAENTRLIANEKNSHAIFKQWNKGIQAAKGELIWIAESDDYSVPEFLEIMVKMFCYDSVMLAFARSDFMQEGVKTWSTEEYLHDLKKLKWDEPFFMTAHDLVRNGFAVHNIIPNVSSCVFRNFGCMPEHVEKICSSMRLSGDWIFYLNLIKGGVVAYTNEVTNFYRIHPASTSLKVQKTEDYYREFESVSCYIAGNYMVDRSIFENVLKNLHKHYEYTERTKNSSVVDELYSVDKIMACQSRRKPNILMACYALISGGGETYPIVLANELKRQGQSVTLMNFNFEPMNTEIRNLVDPSVPLVNLYDCNNVGIILRRLGIEVAHSHHASVDEALAQWLNANPGLCSQVITLHGMYEAIEERFCVFTMKETQRCCKRYIYIADKNLTCFKKHGFYREDKFVKLPNGLPQIEVHPVSRKSLKIEENAFVLTLVSRGIPEKGWAEAAEAVTLARESTDVPIHLVIVGGDPMYHKMVKKVPPYIHMMGIQDNPRDYFAMADMGILPSRFPGESYPLTLIECLMVGTPMIATDIAEVKNQLTDEEGNLAGDLLHLNNWKLDIAEIAERILDAINDKEKYETMKSRTYSASKKFTISNIVEKHLQIYQEVMDEKRNLDCKEDVS